MPDTWQPRFHHPNRIELATGMVTAMADRPDLVADWKTRLGPHDTPRAVLEELVLQGLQQPPLVIGFSGGRDSSALLAVSTHVARREGLPAPVAFTFRYGSEAEVEAETDESSWQELVIGHLGVTDWEKVDVGDRHDMLGELAQRFVLTHGLVFPPPLYNDTLRLTRARGGTFMSGEGGDEVFGVRRSTIWRRLRDNPRYVFSKRHLMYVALALGPRQTRVAAWHQTLARELGDILTYLKPEPRQQLYRDLVWHLTSEPFDLTGSLGWHLRRKMIVMHQESRTAFAHEYGVQHLDPFLEPRFVASFVRMVEPFGLATRSDAMRALFSDLLPEAILTRSSKATFNRGFLTDVSREFAASWRGDGVDTDLVDVDLLRSAWLSRWPPTQTFGLLQAAWLHQNQNAKSAP